MSRQESSKASSILSRVYDALLRRSGICFSRHRRSSDRRVTLLNSATDIRHLVVIYMLSPCMCPLSHTCAFLCPSRANIAPTVGGWRACLVRGQSSTDIRHRSLQTHLVARGTHETISAPISVWSEGFLYMRFVPLLMLISHNILANQRIVS